MKAQADVHPESKFEIYFGQMSPQENNIQDRSNILSVNSEEDEVPRVDNSRNEFNNLMIKQYDRQTKKAPVKKSLKKRNTSVTAITVNTNN